MLPNGGHPCDDDPLDAVRAGVADREAMETRAITLVDVEERRLAGHVVHQEDSHGASVVCSRNGLETLLQCGTWHHNVGRNVLPHLSSREEMCTNGCAHLPSRVPYLQFDPLTIKCYCAYLEINAGTQEQIRRQEQNSVESATKTSQRANKYPMVVMKLCVKESSANRIRIALLPTPESPISNNLTSKSCIEAQTRSFTPLKLIGAGVNF